MKIFRLAVLKFYFARMFFIKSNKFLLAFVALAFCSSCGFWQTAENTNSKPVSISEETKTGIPFESKEPDAFQTEIVVTNFLNGEKTEKIYFLARSGNKALTVFDRGGKTENSVLKIDGKTIFIKNSDKTFFENQTVSNRFSAPDEMLEFLTTEWLSRKTGASFEKLETENNLTNYKVKLDDSAASEIILTFDETLKIPVRQDFYSVSGEEKTLTMTVELKNFQTSADEKLFVLPQDYKKAETK